MEIRTLKQTLINLFLACCDSAELATDREESEFDTFHTELDVLSNPDIHPEYFVISEPTATGYSFALEESLWLNMYKVRHYVIAPKYRYEDTFFTFLTGKKKAIPRITELDKFKQLYSDMAKQYTAEFVEEEDKFSITVYEYYLEFDQARVDLTPQEYAELEHYHADSVPMALQKLAEFHIDDLSNEFDDEEMDDLDEEDEE